MILNQNYNIFENVFDLFGTARLE